MLSGIRYCELCSRVYAGSKFPTAINDSDVTVCEECNTHIEKLRDACSLYSRHWHWNFFLDHSAEYQIAVWAKYQKTPASCPLSAGIKINTFDGVSYDNVGWVSAWMAEVTTRPVSRVLTELGFREGRPWEDRPW